MNKGSTFREGQMETGQTVAIQDQSLSINVSALLLYSYFFIVVIKNSMSKVIYRKKRVYLGLWFQRDKSSSNGRKWSDNSNSSNSSSGSNNNHSIRYGGRNGDWSQKLTS